MKYAILILLVISLLFYPTDSSGKGAGAGILNESMFIKLKQDSYSVLENIESNDTENTSENLKIDELDDSKEDIKMKLTSEQVTINESHKVKQDLNSSSIPNSTIEKLETTEVEKEEATSVSDTIHMHEWTTIIQEIHHAEVGHYEEILVEEGWIEEIPIYEEELKDYCNGCGMEITIDPLNHVKEQMMNGNLSCSGHHTELVAVQVGTDVISHEAEYEMKWVIDQNAYSEKVVIGYECSCGATKDL